VRRGRIYDDKVQTAFPLKQSTTIVWVGGSIVHAVHDLFFELGFFFVLFAIELSLFEIVNKS